MRMWVSVDHVCGQNGEKKKKSELNVEQMVKGLKCWTLAEVLPHLESFVSY